MLSTLTRLRAPSQSHNISSHPPPTTSLHYSLPLAALAARIVYKSPLPSEADLPVYILDAAAFPDAKSVDYDALLPYVLARLPGEEELIGGQGYEVVFFAGGPGVPDEEIRGGKGKKKWEKKNKKGAAPQGEGEEDEDAAAAAASAKKRSRNRPRWGWFLHAYQLLTRAMRKRLVRLYVVHEKGWIRVVMEMFATIVSPKVRKKVIHVNSLTALALHIPIENLLIPPSAYLYDRRKSPDIFAPYASGKRAFGVKNPLPASTEGPPRLPRVLRETTAFLLTDSLAKTEGIFRVGARVQTVEILKEAYDRGQKFIVWKERNTVLTFPQHKEGAGTVTVEELDQIEGYGVHTASALIKLWYHDLREPIFPPSSYQALEKYHGDSKPTSADQLHQLLSPAIVYSPLSETSGRILTDHLLPLLSRIAEHSEDNRMTPENLAVVFAPNMVCGPDPIEDLKISAIVQRLLVDMITKWKSDLAPRLGRTDEMFEDSLQLPPVVADCEDPLEEMRQQNPGMAPKPLVLNGVEQVSGIALVDNDQYDDESSSADDDNDLDDTAADETTPPPLPPRRSETQTSSNIDEHAATTNPVRRKPAPSQPEAPPHPLIVSSTSTSLVGDSPVRRKPAPAVAALPRYSTIVTSRPAVLAALEQYNRESGLERGALEEDSQAAQTHHEDDDLPTYEQSTPLYEGPQPSMSGPSTGPAEHDRPPVSPEKIHRKPIGEG